MPRIYPRCTYRMPPRTHSNVDHLDPIDNPTRSTRNILYGWEHVLHCAPWCECQFNSHVKRIANSKGASIVLGLYSICMVGSAQVMSANVLRIRNVIFGVGGWVGWVGCWWSWWSWWCCWWRWCCRVVVVGVGVGWGGGGEHNTTNITYHTHTPTHPHTHTPTPPPPPPPHSPRPHNDTSRNVSTVHILQAIDVYSNFRIVVKPFAYDLAAWRTGCGRAHVQASRRVGRASGGRRPSSRPGSASLIRRGTSIS